MAISERIVSALVAAPGFRFRWKLIRFFARHARWARTRYGVKMLLNLDDVTNRLSVMGEYESTLVNLIKGMPQNSVFLDIGANQGIFSIVAGSNKNFDAVYAFEPNPFVFSTFVQNIELNQLGCVIPICAGVGSETMAVSFNFSRYHTGAGHISRDTDDPSDYESLSVIIIDPGMIENMSASIEVRHTLCKIDVEGAEMSVLEGLKNSDILKNIDVIFIEIQNDQLKKFCADRRDVYEFMQKNGFKAHGEIRDEPWYDETFTNKNSVF